MLLKPLHPHHLLSWMVLESYPGAYVLGSFARHVTIYSQQMRALNLVDALCKTGQLGNGASVVVVGGGVAGLTAAAAAAVRGASVTIIEKEPDFCPIQSEAGRRYLHPHIYDWPLTPSKEGVADFPFLGWKAGYAVDVFAGLKESWDDFCKNCGKVQCPNELKGVEFTGLEYNSRDGHLEVSGRRRNPPESISLKAHIVILALGFGRETERSYIQKYWDDAPLDNISPRKLRWLVSGHGDGGLTDLMRVCIKTFRHDDFVERFAKDTTLIRKLTDMLAEGKGGVRAMFEGLYGHLEAGSLIGRDDLRTDTEVVFNATEDYLESEGSSILNRFIVFQLEKLGQFTRQDGWLALPIPPPDAADKYLIKFVDENKDVIGEHVFDRLIIRHGPERALGERNFPEIWKASEKLRAKWEGQSQSGDRTRVQIWAAADYNCETAPNPIAAEVAAGAGADLRCVILESTDRREGGRLKDLVESALKSTKKEIRRALGRKQSDPDPEIKFESIQINDALSGQKEYNRAVHLLCQADIAVIDVTGYEPGVMLFLGIRAAVRRGVTLTTTNRELDAAEWSRLPFNLKELYPLSVKPRTYNINSPEHPNRIVGNTIARALGQYHSLSFYQDLPAYEAVRRFEATPKQESQSILWLCSFSEAYKDCEAYLQNGFAAEYDEETTRANEKKYRLERITEIVSPQLVTQRLYSVVRRTTLCLVDWSFWSPNVFFELGVRIAVSSVGPVCLIAKGLRAGGDDGGPPDPCVPREAPTPEQLRQREALARLFNPIPYDLDDEPQQLFKEIKGRHQEMQEYEALGRTSLSIPPTFGAFAYNHTYRWVGRFLPVQNEPGAVAAHELIKTSADVLVGVSATSAPNLPVLYANVNNQLDKQARTVATELLIAAWYYVRGRYTHDDLKQQRGLLDYFITLSNRLIDLLGRSDDEKDKRLGQDVEETLGIVENL